LVNNVLLENPRLRRWILLAVLAIVVVALSSPVRSGTLAVRLALATRRLAAGSDERRPSVGEEKIRREAGVRALEAIVYRPVQQSPKTALVLVPGLSEQGCYHPRLQSLCRALAELGFLVITPDVVEFRQFRLDPGGLDQINFWLRQIPTLGSGPGIRRVGLGGISFSGTLALMAASRSENRNSVGFVLAIGAYYDMHRCMVSWFEAGPRTVPDGQYPTRFYAKWILILAALDLLEDPGERQFMDSVLRALLLQKPLPTPPEGLSDAAQRWYRLSTMREDESDPELAGVIESHLNARLLQSLSPAQALPVIRARVFLVHGAYDDLIPASESRELYRALGSARASLLVTPFLTHTHPLATSLTTREKLRAAWDVLVFYSRLAAELRGDP
jgi:dienelactone hydrolase